jgi:hypothetical protein
MYILVVFKNYQGISLARINKLLNDKLPRKKSIMLLIAKKPIKNITIFFWGKIVL